jgi:pimeloyl-ACP methyl ester carboxylesterase
MRYSGFVTLLLVGVTLSACSDEAPLAPDFAFSSHPAVPVPDASIVGDIGPGASYEIIVPPVWNGDLVLYAHGYVDPAGTDPLTDAERAMLPLLPAMGYAVAWSTYSENGFAVKDGVQRTKQLRGVFADAVGKPERTYVVGGSLGGLVALALAERFPQHYDGVLAVCGMVGGSQAQIDFVAHVRILFDALYPGVIPGGLFDSPVLTPLQVGQLVGAAVTADPIPAGVLAGIMVNTFGATIPASDDTQFLTSLVTLLTFDIRGFGDILDRTHSHIPFDNSEVWYTGSPDDVGLNWAVARYEATRDAGKYLAKYYEPTGILEVPVLTLHNPLDPAVPVFHEALLAASATAAGYQDALTQPLVDRRGIVGARGIGRRGAGGSQRPSAAFEATLLPRTAIALQTDVGHRVMLEKQFVGPRRSGEVHR